MKTAFMTTVKEGVKNPYALAAIRRHRQARIRMGPPQADGNLEGHERNGPPHSACARRASARSHCVTGLEALPASARNSALTHARWKMALRQLANKISPAEGSPAGGDGWITGQGSSQTARCNRPSQIAAHSHGLRAEKTLEKP